MFAEDYALHCLPYIAADQQLVTMWFEFFYGAATIITGVAVLFYWTYNHHYSQRIKKLTIYRQTVANAKAANYDFLRLKNLYLYESPHLARKEYFREALTESIIKLSRTMTSLYDAREALYNHLSIKEYDALEKVSHRLYTHYQNTMFNIPIEDRFDAERQHSITLLKLESVGFIQSSLKNFTGLNRAKRPYNAEKV